MLHCSALTPRSSTTPAVARETPLAVTRLPPSGWIGLQVLRRFKSRRRPYFIFFFFLIIRPPPRSPLFPYPTLSRPRPRRPPPQSQARPPVLEPIEIQIHDRSGEQRQHLTHDQPADDRDAEGASQLRAGAGPERQRQIGRAHV